MSKVNLEANRLLAALPAEALARLRPYLKPVTLKTGEALHRPHETLHHVYFPLEAVVAKIYLSAGGATASLGVIGREGVVGLAPFLGGIETVAESQVIGSGTAVRLGVGALEREFEHGGEFQKTLLAFNQAFMAQTGQIAVCNRHHSVDQQLCFWLLLYLERVSSNEFRVTQELLANLLGVRREGITRAALKLKEAGFLDYKHGRVRILDTVRLKAIACECYFIVHNVYEDALPPLPEARANNLNKATG